MGQPWETALAGLGLWKGVQWREASHSSNKPQSVEESCSFFGVL